MSVDLIGQLGDARNDSNRPRKFLGVMVATVVDNLDVTMQGRVQIHLPAVPGPDPWASVAAPMAGLGYGMYCMPTKEQQVLVAFNNGDPGEPYVIGALWNSIDRPPIMAPTDAMNKRIIRTPFGHTIQFDDATQTLEIISSTLQKITMNPASIALEAGLGAASVQITTAGAVSITSSTSIELNAPKVTINGATSVDVTAGASATLNGGASCSVKGAVVNIN